MRHLFRSLLAVGLLTAGFAASSATVTQATADPDVFTVLTCLSPDHISMSFSVAGATGLPYHFVVLIDGQVEFDLSGTVANSPTTFATPSVAYGVPVEGHLTLDGTLHSFGPTLGIPDGDLCTNRLASHNVTGTTSAECSDGVAYVNVLAHNEGDFTDEVVAQIDGHEFTHTMAPGSFNGFQQAVTPGATVAVELMVGPSHRLVENVTAPSDCGQADDDQSDDQTGDQQSGGQLPATGSSHTLLVVLAGLVLTLGAGLVQLTGRRRSLATETGDVPDAV